MRQSTTFLRPGRLLDIYQGTEGPHGSPDQFECWLLNALAQDSQKAIEIGTWRGRSACFIADGMCPVMGGLTCVDHFKGDDTGGADPDPLAVTDALLNFSLTAKVIKADMLLADWSCAAGADLVFYDADHSTEPTVQVLAAIQPFLAPKCRVVVHDAGWPTTHEAIRQLYARGLYVKITHMDVWHGLELMMKP